MLPPPQAGLAAPSTFQYLHAHRQSAARRIVGFDADIIPPRSDVYAPLHREIGASRQPDSALASDPFRDTALRYAGFANELTEAGKASGSGFFRAINPLGWAVALGYGSADVVNKTLDKHAQVMEQSGDAREAKLRALAMMIEVAIFHTMASWLGPVFAVIKPTHTVTAKLLQGAKRRSEPWATLAALGSIAVVPKILDPIAEGVLHHVYKPVSERVVETLMSHSAP